MNSFSDMLSVVVPAYNEAGMIQKITIELTKTLEGIPHEIIFVDDGSKDDTWKLIKIACDENRWVRGISFSRNFGKESAIYAGLAQSKGGCAVVIDCDLQHPPEIIVEMYQLWKQGYDVVEGVKSDRGDESAIHALCAKCFYEIISKATHIDMKHASDFKLLDRKAINVLLNMKEKNAFFRALASWVGFKSTSVAFEVRERTVGESKWSTWALVKYALSNISSFSTAPMQIVTILGALMLFATVVFGCVALWQKITGVALGGFTTVIILQLFTGSIVMISLGIIGYYISKIYDEVKARPKYIVAATCGGSYDE